MKARGKQGEDERMTHIALSHYLLSRASWGQGASFILLHTPGRREDEGTPRPCQPSELGPHKALPTLQHFPAPPPEIAATATTR